MAGKIEAVGRNVQRFNVGDHVFGTPEPKQGTHAEYICIPEDRALTMKPEDMSWEEAASITVAGNTALYYLRDLGGIQAGQKVLINGASGAIGTFSVQLAKYYGAEVTGVCSTVNVEMVKSLGADKVIDYTKEDFTVNSEAYDVIYDVVNKVPFSACKESLKPKGLYLAGAGQDPFQKVWTSVVGGKRVKSGSAVPNVNDLNFLKQLIKTGELKTVIDRRYALKEIVEAFRYVETGHKKGNVVITVNQKEA